MAKAKKFNVAEVVKQDKKKFAEKIEIEVDGGLIKIDKHFRKTKIGLLVAELVEKFDFARENDYRLMDLLIPYVLLLIIKYFTDITVSDDLGKQLELMEVLINNDYLDQIINAIPQDQIDEVYKQVGSAGERMNAFMDSMDKAKIDNADVLRDA